MSKNLKVLIEISAGKKGLFAPIARRLVEIGGGNKSDLSCGGEKDNDGAKQLANLTETLFKCEIEVNTSCNTANFHKPNMTLINKCEDLVDTFKTAATDCLNKVRFFYPVRSNLT